MRASSRTARIQPHGLQPRIATTAFARRAGTSGHPVQRLPEGGTTILCSLARIEAALNRDTPSGGHRP